MPIAFNPSGFEFVSGDASPSTIAVERGVAKDAVDESGIAEALVSASGFEGTIGQSLTTMDGDQMVVVLGLGEEEASAPSLRSRAAAMYRAAKKVDSITTTMAADAASVVGADAALQAVIEGVLQASYRYDELKGDPKPADALQRVVIAVADGVDTGAVLARAVDISEGVALARDLVNAPGGTLRAVDLADAAVSAGGADAVDVEIWGLDRIREERLGGLLAVNQGSVHEPRLIRWTYRPDGAEKTIVLVGKGITFDTGGLSLKPPEGMIGMKTDMGGAAAVVGTLRAIAAAAPGVNVVGIACCTDNQPTATAIMPGDVFTARNGTTVEVLNTDAEGRLVLADGLSLAAEMEPDAIVDLATLTGACLVALGMKVAGLMGNDDALIARVERAAATAGEEVWHLPLPAMYRKQLDSDIADLKNIGAGRWGGTLTAGLFLKEFAGDNPWVHLDIAGPVHVEDQTGEFEKGATGFGVRTLLELLDSFSESAD